MSKIRERVRQCRQIRELVEENKYTKALEMIDQIPLEEVGSLDDLYLYAELYEKAERMDKKKEIYYMIYERTKSRHVLNKLVRLTIRIGDMQEARDLYVTYEVSGEVTLDTFELRYLLAKAEGEPRTRLIDILEELKKEEYTEEWGFQLARLYELEGMREKCIQECKDLKLWFGDGKIVEKAMELKERCEDPDWKQPVEDEVPEPEKPEVPEILAYASPAVTIEEIQEDGEDKPEEEQEDREESEELGSPAIAVAGESVSQPVVVKKKEPLEPLTLTLEQEKELLEEEDEDVSVHGISYRTLKSTIRHVRYGKELPHFIFAGGEERITLAVAKRIIKELNHHGCLSTHNIGKITADKFNHIDLASQIERIRGGCMLVTNAPDLTPDSVNSLVELLENQGESVVIMLAGPFDEIDCFLASYPKLAQYFMHRVKM